SANPSLPGQDIVFTTTVSGFSGGTPGGTITFYYGATSLGSSSLSVVNSKDQASITVSNLTPGSHAITAIYGGDGTFLASTGTLPYPQVQNVNAGSASEQLSSSVNPSLPGQSVIFTSTLSTPSGGGTPTGNVTFYDGSTSLGSAALSVVNGTDQASISVSNLAVGGHNIIALYSGDSVYASNSAMLPYPQVQNVAAGYTSEQLSSSVNPSLPGQSVIFTS